MLGRTTWELGILLEDLLGYLVGHGYDRGVITFLPGLLKSSLNSFGAEYLQAFLLEFQIVIAQH